VSLGITPGESQDEFIRRLVETAPPSSPELKALLRQLVPPVQTRHSPPS
jgi:hypothetical protein